MCEIKGFKTCPNWLKRKYHEAVKGICQECHKNESEVGKLTPHRLKRGNLGGLYTLVPLNHHSNNIKVVCSSCHSKYHQKEIGCGK